MTCPGLGSPPKREARRRHPPRWAAGLSESVTDEKDDNAPTTTVGVPVRNARIANPHKKLPEDSLTTIFGGLRCLLHLQSGGAHASDTDPRTAPTISPLSRTHALHRRVCLADDVSIRDQMRPYAYVVLTGASCMVPACMGGVHMSENSHAQSDACGGGRPWAPPVLRGSVFGVSRRGSVRQACASRSPATRSRSVRKPSGPRERRPKRRWRQAGIEAWS